MDDTTQYSEEITSSLNKYNDLYNYVSLELGELSSEENSYLQSIYKEWEIWVVKEKENWNKKLQNKEKDLIKQVQLKFNEDISMRRDNLRKTQDEISKLELKLKNLLDSTEKKKAKLKLKEDQVSIRLAQKTAEIQLFQRRVREDTKIKIDIEIERGESLERQIKDLKEYYSALEKRSKQLDNDFEAYRLAVRGANEITLKEELNKLKTDLSDLRRQTEDIRKLKAEQELEKEHYRAQMYRLAKALKCEKEKNSMASIHELEQLRLDFVAKEERYTMGMDRATLQDIREDIKELKLQRPSTSLNFKDNHSQSLSFNPDSISSESFKAKIVNQQDKTQTYEDLHLEKETKNDKIKLKKLSQLNEHLNSILNSGLYNDENDPLVKEITRKLNL
jgi:hypothetical protein